MRFPTLAAATGLLWTAVEAAPRHRDGDQVEARYVEVPRMAEDAAVGVTPRSYSSAHMGSSSQAMAIPEGCPAGSVFVSTTTVDVTVYVAPTANATEPCTDNVGSATFATPITRGPFANNTVATPTPTPEEPCETGSYVNSTVIYSSTKPLRTPMPTGPLGNSTTTTTEPCDDETLTPSSTKPCDTPETAVTSTEPCDETATGHTPATTAGPVSSQPTPSTDHITTMPPQGSTTCAIDTSMTPVAKSTLASTLASTPAATITPTRPGKLLDLKLGPLGVGLS